MPVDCAFCDIPDHQVIAREGPCLAIWTEEDPAGSAMVLPLRHVVAPWDLDDEEWAATRLIVDRLRRQISESHAPAGWNVGWNVAPVGGQTVPHAHCHLVPRYADEAFAGRGLRWWLKHPDNTRGGR
ncbi:MAG: HIT domain-containing protein [Nocardioides sp.]